MVGQALGTSVYVHFPWCLKKCPYCDFASTGIRQDEVPHGAYADAVIAELGRRELGGGSLVSVFFGGGTPSLWDPWELGRVLAAIRERWGETAGPEVTGLEVTVECNPTSLDREKAEALREVGVDRVSIGVQSLDGGRLRYLGRLHDPDGAMRAVRAAVEVMPRVSADLMFGMPGQRADDFAAEVTAVLETGVRHVSAYALTIEPDTLFGALHRRGKLRLAPEEDYAETFARAEEVFGAAGFEHYEVSNYARPGETSRHNQHYWRGGDYLGLGAGAVGAMDGRRYRNDPRPERYLAGGGEVFEERLSAEDRVREALMLGLRTSEGVDVAAVRERTGIDLLVGRERVIERRIASGDLVMKGDRMTIPQARWLHLDGIVADLF